jgi:tripartite-type tricarboxylate transporter receptor subunit TctC
MTIRAYQFAVVAACVVGLWGACAAAASPQANYPTRPIRVIVPLSPGGGSDIIARLLGPGLSDRLGQPVIVDNRPAASGIVGTDIVAKSVPDGHTLLLVQAAHAASAQLHTRLPYDPISDFSPITRVISSSPGMFLHPAVPAKSVKEFVAYARANPGKLNFGSSGPGSTPHLGAELFSSMAGIQMTHVPYKGAAPVITALLGNEVQFAFTNLVSTRPHWQAGRLRLIAISGSKRLEAMPEVPTIAESGMPGYVTNFWWGYMAPANTPRPVVERLNREIVAVASLPEVRNTVVSQGWEVAANTPEEFARIIQADAEKWGAIGRRLGVKLD